MDFDALLGAVFFHFFPVFGYVGLGAGDLIPGDGGAPGGFFEHLNATFYGADIEAETAANTIGLADLHTRARVDGLLAAVGTDVVGVRRYDGAVFGDQIDALMSGVIAGDVAEIAPNAFLLIDAGDRAKGKIEVLEVRYAIEAFTYNIGNGGETFVVHPIREAVAEIFDDAETVMHDRSTNLQAAGAEKEKFGGVAPIGNAAHAGDRADERKRQSNRGRERKAC